MHIFRYAMVFKYTLLYSYQWVICLCVYYRTYVCGIVRNVYNVYLSLIKKLNDMESHETFNVCVVFNIN